MMTPGGNSLPKSIAVCNKYLIVESFNFDSVKTRAIIVTFPLILHGIDEDNNSVCIDNHRKISILIL